MTYLLLLLHLVIVAACFAHILLRRHRTPESRLAWIVVVLTLPYAGALGYLLFGRTSVGRQVLERQARARRLLPPVTDAPGWDAPAHHPDLPRRFRSLFVVGESISGYPAVAGNGFAVPPGNDAVMKALCADIDAATAHVHLSFYIWLCDASGTKIAQALIRAAARGVACRVIVDDIGSRALVRSSIWGQMKAAGVHTARALRVGNPVLRIMDGRIDLRNHRKIAVIDNAVTYVGSQNCTDPAFEPKARFGPWVDIMMRMDGPVVREQQHMFCADWMASAGEDLSALILAPIEPPIGDTIAQVIATGPTYRPSAMAEMFVSLLYAARREVFITTPYYVPNPQLQAAICAAANRGVDTTIIFPARNDDFAVGGTSRSYYEDLLEAGVKVHEYLPGLLHSKTLTLDGAVTLIGSANMDRRSFDLNYENNVLLYGLDATSAVRARQHVWLASTRPITLDEVAAWPLPRRMWNNALAMVGPLL